MEIVVVIVVVLAAIAVFIAMRPAGFKVERSTKIQAAADPIFRLVNDFHEWPAWSPWEKMDPTMQRTYEGANSGTNAGYSWAGNNKVGSGRMTIKDSVPPERVGIKLEFFRPMRATSDTTFTFVQQPDGTEVTWKMDGHNGFVAKAFHLFMDMDKLVGKDFERGLDNLKGVAEKR